jgi:hypothetical protein
VATVEQLARALGPLTSRVRSDVTARKVHGTQSWTRERLSFERLWEHVNGGVARGVSQINAAASTTQVAVLDFDSHKGETSWEALSAIVVKVADVLELEHGMAPILWRSSGGRGVHLYLIWDEAQDAWSVREFLREVLQECGLRVGTAGVARGEVEVFPKQNEVSAEGYGNQVVLPLAGASVPLTIDRGGDLA